MSSEKRIRFGIEDIALVVATAFWGLNFVITKSATGTDPETFRLFVYNIIRFPTAAALLFITLKLRGRELLPTKRQLGAIALLSLIGIFIYQMFYMTGQNLTSSANVGIVYGFTPILILLVSVLTGIEHPTRFMIAGVLVSVSGVLMILFHGGDLRLDTGVILLVCAYFCWALYTVLAKPVLKEVSATLTTAWVLLFGSLYQLPLALWQLPGQSWTQLSGQSILFVVLSGLLTLYVGYTLFYFAVARIGPSRAGVYTNLPPIFTLIFAVLIRGEVIRTVQVAGLCVIVTGIAITKIRIAPATAPAE